MRRAIPLYVLTVALLAVAVYLHSPILAMSIVALWGVHASEDVLTRKNRDADILEMQSVLAVHKTKLAMLEQHISNVAERAKTLLGEF